MRRLSLKQKKIIIDYAKRYDKLTLDYTTMQILENNNDYETLSQDAQRFLEDVTFKLSKTDMYSPEFYNWMKQYK